MWSWQDWRCLLGKELRAERCSARAVPWGALLGVACHLLYGLTGLTAAGTALSYTSAVGMPAVGLGVPQALYSRSQRHRSTGVSYQGHAGCALRAAAGAASTASTRARKARWTHSSRGSAGNPLGHPLGAGFTKAWQHKSMDWREIMDGVNSSVSSKGLFLLSFIVLIFS